MLICVVICNEIRQKWETHVRVTLETVPELRILALQRFLHEVYCSPIVEVFGTQITNQLITIILQNYHTVGSCFHTHCNCS